ncbi:hypothetical protein [Legionella septentrionalis]|uniref:hypothetical protein n=1 Tax=Legionella septentrionalis TaxID=2498109 RepID=UPI001F1BD7B4|nr:hypothetical protein [Legionella septentrionalis]
MKKEEIIENPKPNKPHIVLLGAGASLAAFPNGDANQSPLPIMNNLIEVVDLGSVLEKYAFPSSGNFETIYSKIKSEALKKEIEDKIFQYFGSLVLPRSVTIYDKLLLSLRRKDAIFTFNWDPFLFKAYQRNRHIASLPHIFFLHGNVSIGSCETCDNWGEKSDICSNCNTRYIDVPLLYPIEKKQYFNANQYTAMSWKSANCWFSDAFTLTIFGYGAPTSDTEAVNLLKKAWFNGSNRQFEHIEVIDIMSSTILAERWKEFTPTHHFSSISRFENSRIWDWPRRSSEALFYPMSQGMPCEKFPLIETNDLSELHSAIKEIVKHEN